MEIWFTSDTHYGHTNVMKHDKRPFITVEEMDKAITDNWNQYVQPNDIVWFLGDFCYRNKKPAEYYFNQLNGKIHLIAGNHDDSKGGAHKIKDKFSSYQDYKYLKINNQKINLFHYKMQTWRASNHGSWHLFGHSHGNIKPTGKALDVGIMNKNWKPNTCWLYSFDEIYEYMKDKELTYHHTESEFEKANKFEENYEYLSDEPYVLITNKKD